jgi:DNA recombination protein RmuC
MAQERDHVAALLAATKDDLLGLRRENEQLKLSEVEQRTKLEAERQNLQVLQQVVEESKTHMLHHFKSLASETMQQSNQSFILLAKETLQAVNQDQRNHLDAKTTKMEHSLEPIRELLQRFDHKIHDIEKSRVDAYSSITTQMSFMQESSEKLRSETSNLVRALRAPQVKGRWGELQLRRVIEMAGMVHHCDFWEQVQTNLDEQKLRPDVIVRLPGDKTIVIDAKAVITAYIDASQCEKEEDRKVLLAEHARHIRSRVQDLSRKAYWQQFPNTPEFVVLFLPGEVFFSAALEQDPSLIEQSVDQRVILATPTTLIALLKAVAYGWKQSSLAQNALEISALGKDMHKRLGDLVGHFTQLGQKLSQSVEAYNRSIGTLETRVLVSARKFQELRVTDEDFERLAPIDKAVREMAQISSEASAKTLDSV